MMFRQGEETCMLRKHVGDECHHTVHEAKVIGLTLASKLIARESLIEDTIIGTDNQAAIQALENIKGTPGQHLVDQLHEKIEEVHDIHRHEALEIWWNPQS